MRATLVPHRRPTPHTQVIKTLEAAAPFIALLALEQSRSSAAGAVRASPLVLAVAQLVGISVALPAVWLTSYLLFSAPRVPGAFLPAGKVRTRARVCVSVFVCLRAAAACEAAGRPGALARGCSAAEPPRPQHAHAHTQVAPTVAAVLLSGALTVPLVLAARLAPATGQAVVVAFNLGLPFVSLLWTLAPGGSAPGNAAAGTALRAVGLMALAMHVASLFDLVTSTGGTPAAARAALLEVAANGSAAVQPANFMMFDFLGVLGSALMFVLAEGGPPAVGEFLLQGVFWGPGAALAGFAARREERLAAGAARAKRD